MIEVTDEMIDDGAGIRGGESMNEQEQIDALKAQVNCLREVLEQLAKLGNGDKYGNSIGNTIAINALAKTPEQCLAEVKAKAVERAIKACTITYRDGLGDIEAALDEAALRKYPKKIRKKAKE